MGSNPTLSARYEKVLTGHMVYTLYRAHGLHVVRVERIGAGFHPAPLIIKVSQVIVQEADQPDLVVDLSDAHGLAGERGREIDFAPADADATAACDTDGTIVEWVIGFSGRLVDAG